MLELLLTQKNRLGHLPPNEMHLSVELLLENYYRRVCVVQLILFVDCECMGDMIWM